MFKGIRRLVSGKKKFRSLLRLKRSLATIIEPDCGLLDELIGHDVLTDRQVAQIRAKDNVYDQNELLLKCFEGKPDDQYELFIKALNKTEQVHVTNWIQHDGSESLLLVEHCYIVFFLSKLTKYETFRTTVLH